MAPALGVIKPMKKTEDILKEKARCLIAIDEKAIKAAIADRTRGIGVLAHPKFGQSSPQLQTELGKAREKLTPRKMI